jgi:hypothetical protein
VAFVNRDENITGAIDGVNTTFITSQPYEPGTLAIFFNGHLHVPSFDDGYVETNPVLGVFDMKIPPRPDVLPGGIIADDSLVACYVVAGGEITEIVDNIQGRIEGTQELAGALEDTSLDGELATQGLVGRIAVRALSGRISVQTLSGHMQDC